MLDPTPTNAGHERTSLHPPTTDTRDEPAALMSTIPLVRHHHRTWALRDPEWTGQMSGCVLLRKEVIQPHLPVRLPCYDFVPIASPTFDGSLHKGWATGFGCCRLS